MVDISLENCAIHATAKTIKLGGITHAHGAQQSAQKKYGLTEIPTVRLDLYENKANKWRQLPNNEQYRCAYFAKT